MVVRPAGHRHRPDTPRSVREFFKSDSHRHVPVGGISLPNGERDWPLTDDYHFGMKGLVLVLALVVSAYLGVWGVTWLAGDTSRVVSVASDVGSFHTYPGVFLGGLPPIPTGNLNTPFFAAVIGIVGVLASGVLLRRSRAS